MLIALVALEHVYFLVLEMFLWTTPRTRAAFGMIGGAGRADQGACRQSGALQRLPRGRARLVAARAVGLRAPLALFFLACVLVAGIYGGFTANKRIWLLQALPAAVALAAVIFS